MEWTMAGVDHRGLQTIASISNHSLTRSNSTAVSSHSNQVSGLRHLPPTNEENLDKHKEEAEDRFQSK